jgi:hypothetical protein
MTCIVGVLVPASNSVLIGGDSAGVSGWDVTTRADQKVFTKAPFVMGFTDSFRMGQLLRYSLNVQERPAQMDVFEFMATWFVDSVRSCLKNGGFATKKEEQESGGTFLVGYRGRLFELNSDYQVGESTFDFAACGCGAQIAIGSMYTSAGTPLERARKALEAAAEFSAGVRAPFHFAAGGPVA